MRICFMFLTSRCITYTVNSPMELFDRLKKLRRRKSLKVILLSKEKGKKFSFLAAHTTTDFVAPAKFNESTLVDLDSLDQLAGTIWEIAQKSLAESTWEQVVDLTTS
jgi:hypothetical protein